MKYIERGIYERKIEAEEIKRNQSNITKLVVDLETHVLFSNPRK
jgi:hypothetical protein